MKTSALLVLASACSPASSLQISAPPLPPIPPTSKRLFLVRHGEVIPPGGKQGVFYGALDVDLSPLGKQEADVAADYLAQYDLTHVASSHLKRAIYGAERILERQGADSSALLQYTGFGELDRGSWAGKTKAQIGEDAMDAFNACRPGTTPEGGESLIDLRARVFGARDALLERTEPGCACAEVSHLWVTRSLITEALGLGPEKMHELTIATASISCVDYCQETGVRTVHFQSFKPDVGLEKSMDGAN